MPSKNRPGATTSNSAGFREAIGAICHGNFNVVTCLNLMLMTDYYLIFVTGTTYAREAFGANLSTAGFTSGIMVIGCLLGRFLTGNQISRFGCRGTLLAGLLLFACSMIGGFWVNSLPLLFVQRLLAGIGIGVAGTATGTLVAYVVPVRLHGVGISIFSLSYVLALAMGPFLGISIMLWCSRETLMLVNVGISLFCLVIFFFLRRLPDIQQRRRPAFALYSYIDPRVVRFSLVALMVCLSYGCIQAFITSFAAERGLSGPASVFFLCYAAAALGTRPLTGRIFDRHGEHVILYPVLLLTAVSLIMLAQAHSPAMLLGSGLLLGASFSNFQSIGQAVSLTLVSRSRFAQATTTFFIFFDLGIGLGPYLFGALAPRIGYDGMYQTLAGVVLCSVAVYYIVHGRRPKNARVNTV